jgi:hypothetical protein
MKHKCVVALIGIIEIAIGLISLIAVISGLINNGTTKPLPVVLFIFFTASISLGIGIGVLRRNLHAYHLLLFFSTVIIFSKILIFTGIISLNEALEFQVPSFWRSIISIAYHLGVILYLTRNPVKELFSEKRNVIFSLRNPFCG